MAVVVPPQSVALKDCSSTVLLDCTIKVGPNVSGCGGTFCIYFQTNALSTDLTNKCHCLNLTFQHEVQFDVRGGTWKEKR